MENLRLIFDGAGNGKIYGKEMNAARQISRRFGRATGTLTRSAADNSVSATISVKNISETTSNKIANFSFVCICLVVGIHSGWSDGQGSIVSFGKRLVVEGLGQFAVPWFFVVSGFLMAGHFDEDHFWKDEFVKRIRTLLIPYIVWSLIGFLSLGLLAISADLVARREWCMTLTANRHWFACILGIDLSHPPTLYPLWYVRCLLMFAAIAGVFRFMVNKLGVAWVIIAYVLYLAQNFWWQHPIFAHGFSLSGVFYFSVGMWLRVNNVNVSRLLAKLSLVFGLSMLVGRIAFYGCLPPLLQNWAPVCVPVLLVGVYAAIPSRPLPRRVLVLTFPIFLIHGIVNQYIGVVLKHIVGVKLVDILCTWMLGIVLSGCAAYILRRTRLSTILFGGR